jgi:hypothetical protein
MGWAGREHDHVVHFDGDDAELVAGVVGHLAEHLDASATLSRSMVGDRPDRARFRDVVGEAIAGIEPSRGPVQAFGEMIALLWEGGNAAGAIELERLWNELAEERPGVGGRGLPIVASLSAAHGAEVTSEGKTVWSTMKGQLAG